MKKNFLTAMLFFAFLVFGFQANAQYVNSDVATDVLTTEVENITATLTKANQTTYKENKVALFNFVMDRINEGSSVEDAIESGVRFLPSTDGTSGAWISAKANVKNPQLTVLHQELEDLLSQ